MIHAFRRVERLGRENLSNINATPLIEKIALLHTHLRCTVMRSMRRRMSFQRDARKTMEQKQKCKR